MIDDEATRRALLHRRAQLAEEDELSAADRAPVKLDQDSVGRLSRIDAMQVQAMAIASERRRSAERQRIDSELKRLGDGEYGYCVSCGEPINPVRLQHDPSAAQCVVCAAADSI